MLSVGRHGLLQPLLGLGLIERVRGFVEIGDLPAEGHQGDVQRGALVRRHHTLIGLQH